MPSAINRNIVMQRMTVNVYSSFPFQEGLPSMGGGQLNTLMALLYFANYKITCVELIQEELF